ncbi:hypothetical protein A5659_20015 [Mycobacterium sp. 1165196.3]|nr:hypothetical protein A5659_20015 [Mycobacterium sp. 1165196.3]
MPIVSEEGHHGHQILNFYPMDKDYRESPTARTMVAEHFGDDEALDTDAELLKYGSDHVTLRGAFLEMGVCTGRTINFIAALTPGQRIWGFDSFDGLRNDGPAPISRFPTVLSGPTPRGGCRPCSIT